VLPDGRILGSALKPSENLDPSYKRIKLGSSLKTRPGIFGFCPGYVFGGGFKI
jgi:hypothetical protein